MAFVSLSELYQFCVAINDQFESLAAADKLVKTVTDNATALLLMLNDHQRTLQDNQAQLPHDSAYVHQVRATEQDLYTAQKQCANYLSDKANCLGVLHQMVYAQTKRRTFEEMNTELLQREKRISDLFSIEQRNLQLRHTRSIDHARDYVASLVAAALTAMAKQQFQVLIDPNHSQELLAVIALQDTERREAVEALCAAESNSVKTRVAQELEEAAVNNTALDSLRTRLQSLVKPWSERSPHLSVDSYKRLFSTATVSNESFFDRALSLFGYQNPEEHVRVYLQALDTAGAYNVRLLLQRLNGAEETEVATTLRVLGISALVHRNRLAPLLAAPNGGAGQLLATGVLMQPNLSSWTALLRSLDIEPADELGPALRNELGGELETVLLDWTDQHKKEVAESIARIFTRAPELGTLLFTELVASRLAAPLAQRAPQPQDLQAFFDAAKNGRAPEVQRLLSNYAFKDKDLQGALDLASFNGRLDVVNALLSRVVLSESTALWGASQNGHHQVVQALLDHERANEPQTAISLAHKRTALHLASTNNQLDVVRMLLERGVPDSTTALCSASQRGHLNLVTALLGTNANVNALIDGRAALHLAAYHNRVEVVHALLQNGAAVDNRDNNDLTALHWASGKGHSELVRLLLDNGANVQLQDRFNYTPLHWASRHNGEAVVRLLLEKMKETNCLATIDARMNDGSTALHGASRYGFISVVDELLRYGANATACDNNGCTALHLASRHGHDKVVLQLLTRSPNIEMRNNRWRTAMHEATRMGRNTVVKLLSDPRAAMANYQNRPVTLASDPRAAMANYRNCTIVREPEVFIPPMENGVNNAQTEYCYDHKAIASRTPALPSELEGIVSAACWYRFALKIKAAAVGAVVVEFVALYASVRQWDVDTLGGNPVILAVLVLGFLIFFVALRALAVLWAMRSTAADWNRRLVHGADVFRCELRDLTFRANLGQLPAEFRQVDDVNLELMRMNIR